MSAFVAGDGTTLNGKGTAVGHEEGTAAIPAGRITAGDGAAALAVADGERGRVLRGIAAFYVEDLPVVIGLRQVAVNGVSVQVDDDVMAGRDFQIFVGTFSYNVIIQRNDGGIVGIGAGVSE